MMRRWTFFHLALSYVRLVAIKCLENRDELLSAAILFGMGLSVYNFQLHGLVIAF